MTIQHRASAAERHRQLQALELRAAGDDYDTIAEKLKYADRSGPYRAVEAVLRRRESAAAEDLRRLEDHRLDTHTARLAAELQAIPVGSDPMAVARLIMAQLRVSERRARLHGLDLDYRHHSVNVGASGGLESLKAEWTRLMEVSTARPDIQALEAPHEG
ncbi:hypothetical protein [Rhodococcus indonesiensis]|uniref:hypothetical protein n=1 Tax=Rhodococcus indonesiensis TaxID=3055869 RepID=UPI0039F67CB3